MHPLDHGDVANLDVLDREARRLAQRAGRTQPLSKGPPKRPNESELSVDEYGEPHPKRYRITAKTSPSALAANEARELL